MAWRKLVRPFQLNEPSTFPLKWVQAAVRSGSESVGVRSHPQTIRVQAVRPRHPLCLESLQRELLWPGSQDCSWLKDLALGMRAAMLRYPEVSVRSQGSCLRLTPEGHLKVERAYCESSQYSVVADNPNVDWHAGLSNLQRCQFAPVPIWEGYAHAQSGFREDPGGFWVRNKLLHLQVVDPGLRSEDCVVGGALPPASVIESTHRSEPSPVLWRTTIGEPERWLKLTGAPLCRADIRISAALNGQGRLIFVIGGVSMLPISVDLGCPGCVCVCSGEGLNVDEHQFAIMDDEAYQLRLCWIRKLVRDAIRQLPAHVKHFNPTRLKPYWPQHLLLGALVGAFDPVFGLLAVAGSYWFERCREQPIYSRERLTVLLRRRLANIGLECG